MRLIIQAHCDGTFFAKVVDGEENRKAEYFGYVPSSLGIGGGDGVRLEINLASGKVIDWKLLTLDEVQTAFRLERDGG